MSRRRKENHRTQPFERDEYNGATGCCECGDEFHYDDIGGYNPPCECGEHCRGCHEAIEARRNDYDADCDICGAEWAACRCTVEEIRATLPGAPVDGGEP